MTLQLTFSTVFSKYVLKIFKDLVSAVFIFNINQYNVSLHFVGFFNKLQPELGVFAVKTTLSAAIDRITLSKSPLDRIRTKIRFPPIYNFI